MLHTGYLYKRGNGPINFDWNRRYVVLDSENKKLSYFLRETDAKGRGQIDLTEAIVSGVSEIKGRHNSFTIRPHPKQSTEYIFSAEHTNDAETWVALIDACTPSNDVPSLRLSRPGVGRFTSADQPSLSKIDTEQLFPENTDLFRKLKEKLSRKSKGRKTQHVVVKKEPLKQAQSEQVVIHPPKVSAANFGQIPDSFRRQLETIEKYLTNDDCFKLYKFDNCSRITQFQKEPAFIVNKKNKMAWIGVVVLCLFFIWL